MKAQRKRRVLKWGIGFLIAVLMLGGAGTAALATGKPQAFIVEWAASAFAGIDLDAEGVELFRRVHIDSLAIYSGADSRKRNEPFAEIKSLDLEVDLGRPRRISSLEIDTVQIFLSTHADSANVAFLEQLIASDDAETDVTWLPEEVRIDSVWLLYQDEVGTADLMGVEFEAAFRDNGAIDARIHGTVQNGFHLALTTDETTINSSYESLEIDFAFGLHDDTATAKGFVEQPGQVETRIDATLDLRGDAPVLKVPEFTHDVYQSGWQALGTIEYGAMYANVQSTGVSVKDAVWTLDGKAYPTATISVAVDGLDLNDEFGSLFSGGIALEELNLRGGETLTAQGQLAINETLVCLLEAFQGEAEQRASILFEDWSKSAMVDAMPDDIRGWFEDLAFDTLGGTVGIELRGEEFAVAGDVNSTSERGDAPVGLKVLLNGTRGKFSGTTGELLVSLGEGRAVGKGDLSATGDYTGTLSIESMPIRPFALLALGARLPEHVSGRIDGAVTLVQPANAVTAVVTPQVKLTELIFDEKEQPDLGISGEIAVDTEARIATSEAIAVATPNDELGIVMNKAVYSLDSQEFVGEMELAVDLGWFDSISDAGGLYGTTNTLGTVTGRDGIWEVDFKGTSEDISYGDILLPYGSVMTAEGVMRVTEESLLTEFLDMTISVDDGSRISIPKATYSDETFSGSATVQSDLQILVDMAYLAEVQGAFSGEASWTLDRNTQIDWNTEGTIESLSLLENAGSARGVTLAMSGDYTDAFSGSGTIAAAGISASGATVHDTIGTIGFEDNVLVVSDAVSTLFKGRLNSRVGVFVLEEGTPIRYDGDFVRINLTQLTEEVQPPKTKMTGMANGTLEADYSIGDGLLGFRLEAFADTFFTINRSLVEELLMSQSGLKGLSESTANRTLAKFLGEAPQRPFDSARLDLLLVDEAIEGVAALESGKTDKYNGLNLTVQVSIDAAALAESLKMLENQENTELEF